MADNVGGAKIEIIADDSRARKVVKGFLGFLKSTAKIGSGVAAGMAFFEGVTGTVSELNERLQAHTKLQGRLQAQLGLSDKQAKTFAKTAKSVWKDGFGENLDEVSDAVKQVTQNMKGLNEGEIKQATKDSLTLAKAWDADVNEVTRAGQNLMKGFGIDSKKAFDLMGHGAQNGLNFSNEMFDNLSEYAPLFGQMGYSAEEYFQLLEKGSEAGVYNLDYVNDAWKEFQIRLKDGSKGTSEAMGQLSSGTQKIWKEYLAGKATVKDVSNAILPELKNMKDQTAANQIGVGLWGTKWEDLESGAMYAMANIDGGLKGVDGTMQGITKGMQDNLFNVLVQTGRHFEDLAVTAAKIGGAKAFSGLKMGLVMLNSVLRATTSYLNGDVKSAVNGILEDFGDERGNKIIEFGRKIRDIGTAVGQWFSSMKPSIDNLLQVFLNMLPIITMVGGAIAVAFQKIATFIPPILNGLTGVLAAMTSWSGFVPIVSGLVTAIITYNAILKVLTITQTVHNAVIAAGTKLYNIHRAAMVAYKLAGGGVNGVIKALTVAMRALNLTFLSNPIVLVIALLAGLGVALYTAYKKSETFRNIVNDAWDAIKAKALTVWGFLSPYINQTLAAITDFVKEKMAQVKSFWDQNGQQILQAATNIWNAISAVIKSVLVVVGAVVKVGLAVVSSVFQLVFPLILAIVKSVWGNIQGVINGALNIIMGLIKIFSGLFTGDFKKMWEGIKQLFSGAVQFIWNFIQLNMFGKILSFGKVFASSFKNVFSSLWTNVKTIFSTGVSNVKNFAVNGFNSMKSSVGTIMTNMKTSVSKVFTDIVEGAKALPGKIGDGIKSMAGKVVSGITSLKNKMAETLGEGVNGAIGGVNWVLKKINVKELPLWPIPQYAKGTDGHPGGLAVLGDGKMEELFVTPSGYMGLSPDRDTLMNLPKGTHVFSGPQTKQLMDEGTIPQYSGGTVGKWFKKKGQQLSAGAGKLKDKAIDTAQAGAQKVKDVALDVWSYLDNPKELMKQVFAKFIPKLPNIGGAFNDVIGGSVKKVKSDFVDYIKKKMKDLNPFGGGASPSGKGAKAWRPAILAAAARMNESVSEKEVQGIIAQIHRESGGNEKIVQSSAVWDINTANGNPARGLLQYIPQTFNAYKMKGHGNIYSGYDQLLAFFNNTRWRTDLPYGKRGWGPRGGRKYEKGGIIDRVQMALMGEGNKEEVIIPLEQFKDRAIKLLMYAAEKLGIDMTGMFNAQPQGPGASNFSGMQSVMSNISTKVVSSVPGSSGQPIYINIQPTPLNIDGYELAKIQYPHIDKLQGSRSESKTRRKGGGQ